MIFIQLNLNIDIWKNNEKITFDILLMFGIIKTKILVESINLHEIFSPAKKIKPRRILPKFAQYTYKREKKKHSKSILFQIAIACESFFIRI